MGQIVGGAAKPKRCNLNKLSQLGTPAAGEHILVSSDNSMNATGQGNFDCYIEGDGTKAATALELKEITPATDSVMAGSKELITSGGVYNAFFAPTGEIIKYPDYGITTTNSTACEGNINSWLGFAKVGGIEKSGVLKRIYFGFGATRAYTNVPCRVSRMVKNGDTITGLTTIKEFNVDIPIGDGIVNVEHEGIIFESDYVLEVNISAFGYIRYTDILLRFKDASGDYIRFTNQSKVSGSIWNIDVDVEPVKSIFDTIDGLSQEVAANTERVDDILDDVPKEFVPNYIDTDQDVQGLFSAWYGFSSATDLENDGFIYGVRIGKANVKTSSTQIGVRISQKVRNASGTITGLTTIEQFTANIEALSNEARFERRRFLKDYVVEINAADLEQINVANNFHIQYASNVADNLHYVRFNDQVPTLGSMWNVDAIVSFDEQHERRNLKMLIIGNSFSEDAFSYVPYLLNKEINLTLGILYYGGATLANHNEFLTNASAVYDYEKCVDDGVWQSSANKSIQFALMDEQWDVIVLQQASTAITSAAIQPALNNLINNLYSHVPNCIKLAWHFTLARETDYATSVTHYNEMVDIINDTVVDASPIGWIIPTGTAMQNARTSSLQPMGNGGNLMNNDGHAQEGIPCYVLACCAAESILREMGIQFSVFANNTKPTQLWINSKNIPHPNGTSVGVSAENMRLAQYAALQAVKKPFEITTIS